MLDIRNAVAATYRRVRRALLLEQDLAFTVFHPADQDRLMHDAVVGERAVCSGERHQCDVPGAQRERRDARRRADIQAFGIADGVLDTDRVQHLHRRAITRRPKRRPQASSSRRLSVHPREPSRLAAWQSDRSSR